MLRVVIQAVIAQRPGEGLLPSLQTQACSSQNISQNIAQIFLKFSQNITQSLPNLQTPALRSAYYHKIFLK